MKLKDALIAVVGLVLVGTLALVWFSDTGFKTAPDVDFQLVNGESLPLKTLRGRPILITFWATTCVGCRREVPHLIELFEKYHERGLKMIAVAMDYDPPDQVRIFIQEKSLPYTVALDRDSKVAEAFGRVRLTPTTFIVSPDGRTVFQKLGEFDLKHVDSLIGKLLES